MSSSEGKKRRKKERYLRNREKEETYKKEAWESGKLIEENHNWDQYSPWYSEELGDRLVLILRDIILRSKDNNSYLVEYRKWKDKIRDYIILSSVEDQNYQTLKTSLEVYWDNQGEALIMMKGVCGL